MEWIAKWWLEALFGIMLAGLTAGYKLLNTKIKEAKRAEAEAMEKQKQENALIKEAMQALLRDRIIQGYNHYVHEKKHCPIYALQSIRSMYNAYHALGGNGAVDKLMEDIEDLPTEIRKG